MVSSEGRIESRDSRRHIDYLLSLLDGKDEAVASLKAVGWKFDVFVFWESRGGGGPMLTPSTMSRLAELGIEIGFDVYFLDSDEVNTDDEF